MAVVVNIQLLLFLGSLVAAQNDLVVNTPNGRVRGKLVSTLGAGRGAVRAFLGIPYGEAPVGERRFRAPEPAGGWEGVRDATKFPNTCYQLPDTFFPGFSGADMWNPNTPLSEDCLYLNVWSPRVNHTVASPLAPVLVWIYGGGFHTGTASLDVYDGRFLSQSEGVIVVSMNYRVGALGFLSLPESKSIRGNAGLLDQQLALRWVTENIAAFGGHPSKVTLFGESAGAASVGYHLLSPGSHGLFQRAVMQSASPTAPWAFISQIEARERSVRLGQLLGCPLSPAADLEACLQSADPQLIAEKQYDVYPKPLLLLLPFVPTVDNNFLPDEPEVLLRTGNFLKTEVLVGVNKDEGTYFLVYGSPGYDRESQSLISRQDFLEGVNLAMPGASNVTMESAVFLYTDWADENNGTKLRDSLGHLVGDQAFVCPVLEFTRRYAENGGKPRLFLFDHRSSTNPWPEWMGVMHGYEIEFVFGMPLNRTLGYTQEEVTMSRKFMKHWANFARTGNPAIGASDWPIFTLEKQEYVSLNSMPPETERIKEAQCQWCQFWNNLLPKIQKVSAADPGITADKTATIVRVCLQAVLPVSAAPPPRSSAYETSLVSTPAKCDACPIEVSRFQRTTAPMNSTLDELLSCVNADGTALRCSHPLLILLSTYCLLRG